MPEDFSKAAPQGFDIDLLRPFLGDKVVDTMRAITAISGHEMTPEQRSPFVAFRLWLNTRPYFIEQWRKSESDEIRKYEGLLMAWNIASVPWQSAITGWT